MAYIFSYYYTMTLKVYECSSQAGHLKDILCLFSVKCANLNKPNLPWDTVLRYKPDNGDVICKLTSPSPGDCSSLRLISASGFNVSFTLLNNSKINKLYKLIVLKSWAPIIIQ